ncbi:hypothetical protein [Enterobacter mori]|uniref:hypothetical protein n=1 Tax=Enterobacter mori TaxID=539813 RepID=UPI001B8C4D5A|nr:hypothetical protein [Enterobacter mori]MBS3050430.1 hypothetical protein [Enterobacter mori]
MEQTGFKEGKLYRADRTHPEKIENNDGFYISEDFSAVNKMIDADALIVSESLEGIYNYIMLSGNMKGYYIYEIIADDVRGVSLNTNMEHNKDGLRHFITAGCPEYWTDVEPDDWFELTQGANKLEEVHVYHSDVNREKIKYLGPAGDVFRDKATF